METARAGGGGLAGSASPPGSPVAVVAGESGWLYKKGRIHKNWKRRWMVQRGPQLFYFTQPHLKDVPSRPFPFQPNKNRFLFV
jgi:hypothetical protein